jgi:hypothetical protein
MRSSEWVKAGKSPFDFLLDEKRRDELIERAYPKKERDRDAIFGKDRAADEKEPLPSTPADINPAGWVPIVQSPPLTASGKPWPLKNWAQVLQKLHDDPSEETKAVFNERFEATGLTADKVLEKFGIKATAPPASSPATPAASAAPPSASREPPAGETSEQRRQRFESEHAAEMEAQRGAAERQRATEAEAGEAAREAAHRRVEQARSRPLLAAAQAEAARRRPEDLMVDLTQRIKDQRTRQERRDLAPEDREFAAGMGDAYQHELDAIKMRQQGDERGAAIEDELGALASREAALRKSGLAGAFMQAQLRRIEGRRAELEAEKGAASR